MWGKFEVMEATIDVCVDGVLSVEGDYSMWSELFSEDSDFMAVHNAYHRSIDDVACFLNAAFREFETATGVVDFKKKTSTDEG